LKFIRDPNLFNLQDIKKYYTVVSIDLSEGLSEDYTVINVFRLTQKSWDVINIHKHKFADIYDFFQINQIAMFRSNVYSLKEVAHIFYLLMFEVFNPERTKVVLEWNKLGGEFMAHLPHVFNDNNNFANNVFLRFKHNKNDLISKIGLLITKGEGDASKKILIKDFQDALKKESIKVFYDVVIRELSMFSKKETSKGTDFTYASGSGNDDSVMTLINISSVFKHVFYKDLVEQYMQTEMTDMETRQLKGEVSMDDSFNNLEFGSIVSGYKKIYNNKNTIPGRISPFGKDMPLNNPFSSQNPNNSQKSPGPPYGKGYKMNPWDRP
jgi:hypothetical protein